MSGRWQRHVWVSIVAVRGPGRGHGFDRGLYPIPSPEPLLFRALRPRPHGNGTPNTGDRTPHENRAEALEIPAKRIDPFVATPR